MNNEPYVVRIQHLYEKVPSRRQLKITLSNGTVVRAEACYESWQQWGGRESELWITMPVVENHNDWLHGGCRPASLKNIEPDTSGDCNPIFGRR